MNFSKGILESRRQTYKHLTKILRPLPLDTPTIVQLSPGNELSVTLIDANHCLGAVMFLIESKGKAILYTGDVRAESWWVNSIVRNPSLIRYTTSSQSLDKIYLDTTFATKSDPYRSFPSKAEGVCELLDKLSCYPDTCIFYFHAWTFGYEDVWKTLADVIGSQVHLDGYRYSIYTSIDRRKEDDLRVAEAPSLCGFVSGNERHPGILTKSPCVRIHSCERGTGCYMFDNPDKDIVDIMPIITRHKGVEMRELGAGGGHGDLNQNHELDLSLPTDLDMIMALCYDSVKDAEALQHIAKILEEALVDGKRLQLDDFDDFKLPEDGEIPLAMIPQIMTALARKQKAGDDNQPAVRKRKTSKPASAGLPKSITFPYSRHSSYNELRELVAAFRPRDVWPCTAPPPKEWDEEMSMDALFGDLCSTTVDGFAFDKAMRAARAEMMELKQKQDGAKTQAPTDTQEEAPKETQRPDRDDDETDSELDFQDALPVKTATPQQTRTIPTVEGLATATKTSEPAKKSSVTPGSNASLKRTRLHASPSSGRRGLSPQENAFYAAQNGTWCEDVQLASLCSRQESQEL